VQHFFRKTVMTLAAAMAAGFNPAHAGLNDPLAAGWEGQAVCEKLHEDADNRILRCTFPPGVGHERHFHAPHFGYALSGGRMRMTDSRGVREVDLTTGSSFSNEGVDWHEVLNIGTTTVSYLIIEPTR
jgi:quercetin dioxygenase-like cupin family protein